MAKNIYHDTLAGKWFIGTACISMVCHHHPPSTTTSVHPSIHLSLSFPQLMHQGKQWVIVPHPPLLLLYSPSFSIKGSWMVAVMYTYEYARTPYPLTKLQVKWFLGSRHCIKMTVFGVWLGKTLTPLIPLSVLFTKTWKCCSQRFLKFWFFNSVQLTSV